MTLYTARVWAKDTMPYDVEVNAASSFDAQTIIARREGVKTVSYTHLTLPTKRIV